jgi:hypothetical protein
MIPIRPSVWLCYPNGEYPNNLIYHDDYKFKDDVITEFKVSTLYDPPVVYAPYLPVVTTTIA